MGTCGVGALRGCEWAVSEWLKFSAAHIISPKVLGLSHACVGGNILLLNEFMHYFGDRKECLDGIRY